MEDHFTGILHQCQTNQSSACVKLWIIHTLNIHCCFSFFHWNQHCNWFFSARYGSYTMMGATNNKILTTTLIQVRPSIKTCLLFIIYNYKVCLGKNMCSQPSWPKFVGKVVKWLMSCFPPLQIHNQRREFKLFPRKLHDIWYRYLKLDFVFWWHSTHSHYFT